MYIMENKKSVFQQAVELEDLRCKALMSNSAEELSVLLSDDLYYGHSSGYGDNKQGFLKGVQDHLYVYKDVSVKVLDVHPVGGEGIVINGEITLVVDVDKEEKTMSSVYVAVWRKENSKWLFLTHQTAIKRVQ
jgi:hypothetical protein